MKSRLPASLTVPFKLRCHYAVYQTFDPSKKNAKQLTKKNSIGFFKKLVQLQYIGVTAPIYPVPRPILGMGPIKKGSKYYEQINYHQLKNDR